MKELITLRINGENHELYIEPKRTLLEVLQEDIGLTGTKEGCDLGACGACTALLDNKPILSCLTLAITCKGKEITTIEGLSQGETLHPLQVSFIEEGAIQCGYCTPGMVLSAKGLLDETPHPTDDQIETAIEGNLCRCGAYLQILKAIKTVIGNNK